MDPKFLRACRRRNLLLALVVLCVVCTPAWFLPIELGRLWLLVGLVLGVPSAYISWRYAPWVPTPEKEVARILRLLNLQPHEAFCDLGAGDGRMVVRIQRATGADCAGIEVSPAHYLMARVRLAIQGNRKTSLIFGHVHGVDLSRFDALYVWGTGYWVATPEFADRIRRMVRPGGRLVSYHYPLHGMKADCVDEDGLRPLHLYVQPFKTT